MDFWSPCTLGTSHARGVISQGHRSGGAVVSGISYLDATNTAH